MTPAEELTRAANKLDALTMEATEGPWRTAHAPGARGRVDVLGVRRLPASGCPAADGHYIAAMNPLVGKALAVVMREAADVIIHNLEDRIPQGYSPIRVASAGLLDLARLINGGAS